MRNRQLIATGVLVVLVPALFVGLLVAHELVTSHFNLLLYGNANTPTPVSSFLGMSGPLPPVLGLSLTVLIAFGLYDAADIWGFVPGDRQGISGLLPPKDPIGFLVLRFRRYGLLTIGPGLMGLFCYFSTPNRESGLFVRPLTSDIMLFLFGFGPSFAAARRPLNWSMGNWGSLAYQYVGFSSRWDGLFYYLGWNNYPTDDSRPQPKPSVGLILFGFMLVCVFIPPLHAAAEYYAYQRLPGRFADTPAFPIAICVGIVSAITGFWQWWDVFAYRGPKFGADYHARDPKRFCLAVIGIHLLGLPAVAAGLYFIEQGLAQGKAGNILGDKTAFYQILLTPILICRWFAPVVYGGVPSRGEPLRDAGVPS